MKKFIYSAAALVFAFFAASCQQENLEPVGGNTVTYTVQVPDALATKAIGDAHSGVTKLIYEVYREAQLDDLSAAPIYDGEAEINAGGVATLELEFVKNQKFTVLFWAQNPDVAVYTTDDLRNVQLAQSLTANNVNTAVFAGSDKVDNCVSAANGAVDLVRPIAQLRIGTTPESLDIRSTHVTLKKSDLKVKGLSTTYNVATKAAGADKSEFTYSVAAVPEETFKANNVDYQYVAMNYVGFASDLGANIDVEFNINTSEGVISHEVVNVPVKPNYRTNIVGNLITASADYNVSIDDNWEPTEHNVNVVTVSDAQGLQAAIDNSEPGTETNIKLEGNIDLGALAGLVSTKAGAPTYGLLIPTSKALVLDLNGCTLSQTVEQTGAYSMILNKGTLTIDDSKGNGKISYTDSKEYAADNGYVSNTITNNGTLIIKGGIIENNSEDNVAQNGYPYAIDSMADNGGNDVVTNIEGGTIKSNYSPLGVRPNSADKKVVANITGGNIKGRIDFQMLSTTPVFGELNISGGSFDKYGIKNYVLLVFGAGVGTDASGMKANITGGTFNAGFSFSTALPIGSNFNKKFISGGEFSFDPYEYLADGYIAEQEGDKYVVYKAVAAIGETMYKSIEDAISAATAENEVVLLENIQVAENTTIKIEKGKTLNLNLNKKTLSSTNTRTATHNDFINVQGTLNVKDGTITYKHTGDNMAWNGCTNLLDVTAGGVVNMTNVVAENLGGTDMNFAAHLNNWGSVTVNAENCEFLSTYCGFRVFNSGYDVNDVTIKNSKFTGASRAFWVHNYIGDLNSTQHTDAAITARLKLDIYNNGNTFEITGTAVSPIRFGFGNTIYFAENGSPMLHNAASLKWFANEVNERKNSFNGKTVKLVADIDLNNEVWTPIGQTGATTFNGVFDGQNYTISNLNVNSEEQTGAHYSSGLFGWVESHTAGHGHIKNVKIAGATISGHHNCGALVGYITQETALVENCHVTGATITCTKANDDADGDKAGALIGNATVATPVKDCTAAKSTVSAGRDAGQVIGAGNEANVTGCSATEVTVAANGTGTGANVRNEVIGRLL